MLPRMFTGAFPSRQLLHPIHNAPSPKQPAMKLTEDDLYRSSTQFRNWSFTSEQLAAQRIVTNTQASERVRANVARQRAQRALQAESDSIGSGVDNGSGANTPNVFASETEVDCLTVDEERKIVDDFCERSIKLGAHCGFPFEVTVCTVLQSRKATRNSPRSLIHPPHRRHVYSSSAASTSSTHP